MPVDNPKSFSLDVYLPKNGKYTIQVRAIDEAGNIGTSSVNVNYNKGEGTSTKIPGFEASFLIVVVLVMAIVVARRKNK
jgi:hypothetical protein